MESLKKILKVLMKQTMVEDEALYTGLTEIDVLNSGPMFQMNRLSRDVWQKGFSIIY